MKVGVKPHEQRISAPIIGAGPDTVFFYRDGASSAAAGSKEEKMLLLEKGPYQSKARDNVLKPQTGRLT